MPGTQTTVSSNVSSTCGITVDVSGNVYTCDPNSPTITKWTLNNGTYSQSTLLTTSATISAFTIDGAGNIYIIDEGNSILLEETLAAGTYSESTIGTIKSGWRFPIAVIAVDGVGSIYFIAESLSSNDAETIFKYTPSSSGYVQSIVPTGTYTLSAYSDLAADGAGDVYVSNFEPNADGSVLESIYKETPSGGSYVESTAVESTQTDSDTTFTVDGNSNIYFAGPYEVFEAIPSGNGYTTVPISNVNEQSTSLVFDGGHNVYYFEGSQLLKLDEVDPPMMNFVSTNIGTTSTDSPKTVTVRNVGNAPLTFSVPSTGTNPSISANFSLNNVTTCPQISVSGTGASVNANTSCIYGIDFSPTTSGLISGSLVLSDNAFNAVNGTQTIPLSGTGSSNGDVVVAVLTIGASGVPQVTLVPNVSTLNSSSYAKIWVDTYHQTLISGFVFLQTNQQGQLTCQLYSEATVTPAPPGPLYGTLFSTTEKRTLPDGQCPGIPFPFTMVKYTWGSKATSILAIEQDPFVLQVRDQYGDLNEYGYTAELAHITVTKAIRSGSGANPPMAATATLINYPAGAVSFPSGAMNYEWTITGGGGAIVFPNGQETMRSTTNSITIEEPNPIGGSKVPFMLSVNVSTSNGTLQYGPIDDVFWNVPEVTVIRWVNCCTQDINNAVSEGPSTPDLANRLTGGPVSCSLLLYDWLGENPIDIETAQDSLYASDWLLQHSGNPTPPPTIDPSDFYSNGSYRLFNDFGSGENTTNNGPTPFPCSQTLSSWWAAESEASPYMGDSGTTASGNTYQLAEAQVGSDGQTINFTINGVSTPWIWSVVEFDPSGNPSWNDYAIFPSYSVYIDGQLTDTIQQGTAQTFIEKGASYLRVPSQIQ